MLNIGMDSIALDTYDEDYDKNRQTSYPFKHIIY